MELVNVFRYENDGITPEHGRTDHILEKLKQKAEKRRLQALNASQVETPKKQKKRRSHVVDLTEAASDVVNGNSGHKKHKEKKSERKSVAEFENADDGVHSHHKHRKRKLTAEDASSVKCEVVNTETECAETEPSELRSHRKKKKRKSELQPPDDQSILEPERVSKKRKGTPSNGGVTSMEELGTSLVQETEKSKKNRARHDTNKVGPHKLRHEKTESDVKKMSKRARVRAKKIKAAPAGTQLVNGGAVVQNILSTDAKVTASKRSRGRQRAKARSKEKATASRIKDLENEQLMNGVEEPHDISQMNGDADINKISNEDTNIKKRNRNRASRKQTGNERNEQLASKDEKIVEISGKATTKNEVKKLRDKNVDLTANTEFTVIGQDMSLNLPEVSTFLPDWVRHPTIFSTNLHADLTDLDQIPELHPNIMGVLEASNIRQLFPVQSCVIPQLLRAARPGLNLSNDICVSAPTGSGKTLAFVLPIIQALRSRVVRSIRALVVLPVHELAIQVFEVFKTFCAKNNLNVGLAAGVDTLAHEQLNIVKKGFRGHHSLVDILVCTPGRLVDHIKLTEGFTLKDLRFLVIDEADRMMNDIKHGWLQKVTAGCSSLSAIPITPSRLADLQYMPQKLLFSATLSHDPEKLESINLFQPSLFVSRSAETEVNVDRPVKANTDSGIGQLNVPQELTQLIVVGDVEVKPLTVLHLLHNLKYRHVLCFTNSLSTNTRLFDMLSSFGGLKVVQISSNDANHVRRRKLDQFKAGLIDVIVCTDAMARGIDVDNVECVISYEMPLYAITYVHRAGRTARAGRQGTAISLLKYSEEHKFTNMLKAAGIEGVTPLIVTQAQLEPLVPQYQKTLEIVKQAIKDDIARKSKRTF